MIKTNDGYLDSNEFREILRKYEESVKSGRPLFMEADDLTDIAQYYSMLGDWNQASDTVDYAISIHPGSVPPIAFKARMILLRDNDPKKAEKIADTIDDKNDLDYYYIKAEILLAQDKVEEADEYLLDCLDHIEQMDYEDFVFDVANMYEDYEQFDKIREWLSKSKTDIKSIEYKELMARTLLQTGNFEESKTIFNELIDHDPYSAKYWKALSLAQQLNGELKDSIISTEYAIAIDPTDSDAIRTKAEGLFKLDNYEEAIKYYQRFVDLCPLDDSGEMMIGICSFNLQKYKDAITHLKKAEQLTEAGSTNMIQIYQELAFSLNECGQHEEAISYIDKMDDWDCDHIEMQVLKGHFLLTQDKLDDALNVFKKAIIDSGSSPDVILHIAVSVLDNRFMKKAYDILKMLFNIGGPRWKKGYSHMALCCKELGMNKEFLEYLKIATEKNPDEAKDVLGDLFPENTEPKDYYNYMYNKLNSENK
jgi:tetratricopeptide (TPR) repeat protein